MKVQEQYLVGNTFLTEAEMAEMAEMATPLFFRATPFLSEVLPSAVTVSTELLVLEGCPTSQNVRNGHIMGGQQYIFISKSQ